MNKSKVVLVPCKDYEQALVNHAIATGFALLGEDANLGEPTQKILLKPNFLRRASAEKAITTHPAVFEAVGTTLLERGYRDITYGDSPGNPLVDTPAKVATACGIAEAAGRLGIAAADFDHGKSVSSPQGKYAHSFTLCPGVLQADVLINLCKMKTHALQRVTGAVKNIYGCIYGLEKGMGHARHSDAQSFAHMLADLHLLVRPRLHIMDGITAMEGNGPAGGDPVQMGVLLFSADPVALDSVMCALMHLDPALVPTNAACEARGIGRWRWEDIEVVTPDGIISPAEAGTRYGKENFNVSRQPFVTGGKTMFRSLQNKPVITRQKCIGCGICVQSCPVEGKALVQKQQNCIPAYDYKKCIRCYCCQEMCPKEAISVKTPLAARLLGGGTRH